MGVVNKLMGVVITSSLKLPLGTFVCLVLFECPSTS